MNVPTQISMTAQNTPDSQTSKAHMHVIVLTPLSSMGPLNTAVNDRNLSKIYPSYIYVHLLTFTLNAYIF